MVVKQAAARSERSTPPVGAEASAMRRAAPLLARTARASRLLVATRFIGLLLVIGLAFGCERSRPATDAPHHENDTQDATSENLSHQVGARGTVTSQGQPLPNATVRYQSTRLSTQTDAGGRFELPAPPARSKASDVDAPLVVTASREGYLIGSQPWSARKQDRLSIQLMPLPTLDHEDYPWVHPDPDATRPGNCGNCHGEIHEQWSASAHARGTANRRFLNLYEGSNWRGELEHGWSLVAEHPEGLGVCAACHAPSADLEHLAIGDIRDVDAVAARGVHCDFCHKVQDSPLIAPAAKRSESPTSSGTPESTESPGPLGLVHGRFGLALLRPESPREQLFFGSLDDVDRGEDSYAAIYRESRYCASCHEGTVFGVPVYTTYSEWLASPAREQGKQCQDCHMRPSGALTNVAPGAGGLERDPQTLASHEMLPGGRLAMLRDCLRLEARWGAADTASATPSPTSANAVPADAASLSVQLQAREVGHRVPTGFIDRHLLLVVEAFDAAQQPVAMIAGPRLPDAAGDLRGLAGQVFARRWVDPATGAPQPFWRPGGTLSDNRLEPQSTRVETFAFPANAARVRVRLLFRGFWADTARDKGWPDDTLTVHECLLDRPVK